MFMYFVGFLSIENDSSASSHCWVIKMWRKKSHELKILINGGKKVGGGKMPHLYYIETQVILTFNHGDWE